MKIYSDKTVLEASRERISYLFDEFPNIVVGMSGGKDSTVVFNLTLDEARKRGRLPLNVMWIDQEVEWQGTADYMQKIMEMPEVKPYWYQMPMVITNNANSTERYAYCWREADKKDWMREKHPMSIKENVYGTDRFHDLFAKIMGKEFDGIKTAKITGVRAEESPRRSMGATEGVTYKGITWGKVENRSKEHYAFHIIFDWSYTDVWKYIYEHKLSYNKVYDRMYQYGAEIKEMRISNLHHETAIHHLETVQEIEPDSWSKVVKRVVGANTIKHIKDNSFKCPKELPYMFHSWEQYAMHLLDNIIQDENNKKMLLKRVEHDREIYVGKAIKDDFYRNVINTILSSDWDFTKYDNWANNRSVYAYKMVRQGKKEYWKDWYLAHLNYMDTQDQLKLLEHLKNDRQTKRTN